jgi:hypothetical protein
MQVPAKLNISDNPLQREWDIPEAFDENESPPIVGRSPKKPSQEGPVSQSQSATDAFTAAMPGASIFGPIAARPDVKCGERCGLVRLQGSA